MMRDIEKQALKAIRRLEASGTIGRNERSDIAIIITRLLEDRAAPKEQQP